MTGALPAGMGPRQWDRCGKRAGRGGRAEKGEMGEFETLNHPLLRNVGRRGRREARKVMGPAGNGQPGQYTRWGGLG